ncbi:hypothetical protein H8E88_29300 [candidate division KSB1 bacterium]|nr:hypothetical protein [candidate division KSB1 bacterium]
MPDLQKPPPTNKPKLPDQVRAAILIQGGEIIIRIQDITIIQYFDKLIYKLWQLPYQEVLSLGLENRLVPVKNVSHIRNTNSLKPP